MHAPASSRWRRRLRLLMLIWLVAWAGWRFGPPPSLPPSEIHVAPAATRWCHHAWPCPMDVRPPFAEEVD
jgi:hypothetical protein